MKDVARWSGHSEAEINAKSARNRAARMKQAVIALRPEHVPQVYKPSKFRNKIVEWRGEKFSSIKELRRYQILLFDEMEGSISELVRQPRTPIVINGIKLCTYVADFSYQLKSGAVVYEDVKPDYKNEARKKQYQMTSAYRMFRLKKILMKTIMGIDVREV